jgi:hypothetical protein
MENKLKHVYFGLDLQPDQYQLTVHINNLLVHYYNQKKFIIKEFKKILDKGEVPRYTNLRMRQIIDHYGIYQVRVWFSMVYGWKFEKSPKVFSQAAE